MKYQFFVPLTLVFELLTVSFATALSVDAEPVHVLVYETESSQDAPIRNLVDQIQNRINGITVSVFGEGEGYNGYGSKFSAVLPVLKSMENLDSLVVISDSRDVLINNPHHYDTYVSILADEFKMAYDELTYEHPGAIVISAEAQCCVSALTHASPGSYFNSNGSRKEHACSSGEEGCLWAGDENALPWELFMKDLMLERTVGDSAVYDDMYLNAGLMAGKAKDLIRVIQAAQIFNDEDDQAVLTDYMYHHPEDILLDYKQMMFGNNRGGIQDSNEVRCVFASATASGENRLVHAKTGTSPLFVHSPGGFYECHDQLAESLGVPALSKTVRRRYQQARTLKDNYGKGDSMSSIMSSLRSDAPTAAPGSVDLASFFLAGRGNRQLSTFEETVPTPN